MLVLLVLLLLLPLLLLMPLTHMMLPLMLPPQCMSEAL